MNFNEIQLSFLQEYLNTASPTGWEKSGQLVWKKYIENHVDELHNDSYGNCYAVINPGKSFKVVLEAHADEIGWYVNYIADDGFIYVVRNGGSDQALAPGKKVNIHTDNSTVIGVFGWPAIHTRTEKPYEPLPKIENLFIDVGAKNKEEVIQMGIKPGCMITYPDSLDNLNNTYLCGRALDNRIGGFMIAETAKNLFKLKEQLNFSIYIVNAVQEEVGLHGAGMMAHSIAPDIAIITDVTHDTTTPHIDKKKEGEQKCGKGPVLYNAPSIHHLVRKHIEKTAEINNISIQHAVASRASGTDTDAFAYSQSGIPSALISLPLKYMHTAVEMAHHQDIQDIITLMTESVIGLNPEFNLDYFKA